MKEQLKEIINSFFISVTLINMAMLILGFLFRPEQKFGYEVLNERVMVKSLNC